MPESAGFLDAVTAWASGQPGVLALALVGSHARGQALPDSDIDLLLLLAERQPYLADLDWLNIFGQPKHVAVEDWGKVTSVRAWYAGGPEVEFGLSPADWGADPMDAGDAGVIRGGMRVLYEVGTMLSDRIDAVLAMKP